MKKLDAKQKEVYDFITACNGVPNMNEEHFAKLKVLMDEESSLINEQFDVKPVATVPQITTVPELRKELKKIGFNVKTMQLSWGPHANYFNLEGKELPSLFHAGNPIEPWQPLYDFIDGHADELRKIREVHNVYGLLI